MLASENFVRFVYDGDNSTGEGTVGPPGSGEIEAMFNRYFRSQGLATEPTAFDGRSDYNQFILNGIPAGGIFTGAEGIKTPEQEAIFGGVAGLAYDPCYHQACDTLFNLSHQALDEHVGRRDARGLDPGSLQAARWPARRPPRRPSRPARPSAPSAPSRPPTGSPASPLDRTRQPVAKGGQYGPPFAFLTFRRSGVSLERDKDVYD